FPGIGRYVSNLAQAMALQLAAHERLILLTDPTRPSRWQLPAQSEQIRWVETAVSPFSLSQQYRIPRLLKQQNADVYHSPYYLMPYAPGLPTVVTIYDLIPKFFPQYVSVKARLFFHLSTRLALHTAQHIIVISEASRRDLLRSFALSPVRVTAVPLAPDPHFQSQPDAEMERIRQKYNLPDSYTLYLGINKPHKNLARLLDAWTNVNTKMPLVVAGAWDERYPQIKNQATDLGLGDRVIFLGPVDEADLPGLYAGAMLFVFPSLYEGFGLPVMEAMACGTAVICANSSSLPEVAGNAALYFDPHDTADITLKINQLLAGRALQAEYEKKALKQAKKFSWEVTALSTLQLYRSLTVSSFQ
ncbi:MAG: glycosyltransferase family 4 protein, partial [Chloroflexi bacterium]|nr:glycosyltransferase family 4 protein [Chloroflexota bacterium]